MRLLKIKKPSSQFLHDYRLPIKATLAFILLLAAMFFSLTFERLALADILKGSLDGGKDYAALINTDKSDEFKKNETNEQPETPTATPPVTQAPFTVNPSAPPTQEPADDGNEEAPPPPPSEPFMAEIAGFGSTAPPFGPYACDGSAGSGSGNMCKSYQFAAGVNTYNGPGTVKYSFGWRSTNGGHKEENEGSFAAPAGSGFTRLNHSFSLKCSLPSGPYAFKFALQEPTQTQSNEIIIHHDCGAAITPGGGM